MENIIDILGMSWNVARNLLDKAQMHYNVVVTRPTKNFFSVETGCLYVLRQKWQEDGSLQIVLAERLRKEVS